MLHKRSRIELEPSQYNSLHAVMLLETEVALVSQAPGYKFFIEKSKIKAIPVTGSGGIQVCETSRIPHFQGNGSQIIK
jgi:hypothetical protein